MKTLFIVLFTFFSSTSWAGGLGAPFSFESTGVLPKGIRNVSYQGFTTSAYNKYNTDGNGEAIGKPLNKSLTWQDIINGQDSAVQAQSLQALLLDLGQDLNQVVGDTTGVVNARATVSVPVLAYGVMSWWTTALAVPIVYTSTNIDTGFVSNQVLDNFIGNELAAQNLSLQAEAAARKFVGLLNQKAIANGYEPIASESKMRIGDIKWVQKFQVLKNPVYAIALKQDITLPTGTPADPNKLIDVGSGDAQWDLGFGAVVDWFVGSQWTLTGAVQYTAQLPDTVTRRLPISVNDTISADIDSNTYRDLGDIFSLSTAAKFTFFETWTASTAYAFQTKNPDTYVGSSFESFRYEILEFDTHQRMHSLQLGLGYSTIPLFRKQRFPLPLQASLGYTWVIAGENVAADGTLGFQMSVFF